ncbi:MAG: hypothetical protein JO076_02765 [Verrucomicrobia bacterium]|nr:hypothetical protein [Verrucomicrobiota bacterium]
MSVKLALLSELLQKLRMLRVLTLSFCVAIFLLVGCDNRTADAVRWDQIAAMQRKGEGIQPWTQANSPWRNAEHRKDLPW